MANVKVSIRYKFLMATSFLLVGSVFAYLGLASHVFTKDKTQLVYDYNRSFVSNLVSEIDKLLDGSAGKMKLAAILRATRNEAEFLPSMFEDEKTIAGMFVSEDSKSFSGKLYWNQNFFDAYATNQKDFIAGINEESKVPWDLIKKKGSHIWALNTEQNIPVFAFAKVVIAENSKRIKQYIVLSIVRLDSVANSVRSNRLSEVFLMSENGDLIFTEVSGVKFNPSVFLERFKEQAIRTSVFEYEETGNDFLAASSRTAKNEILVVARASKKDALSVVDRFIYRSILFASIVLTLAFIVAIFFSRNLTRPIEKLLKGMKKVASGDLAVSIELNTRDEIHLLADNFNTMIGDLRSSRQELEDINRDLEHKVKERTLRLEEQNLAVKDAQEALLKTSRLAAAGEIAGRAAHEVLNPLTSILTRTSKMEDRILDGLDREVLLFDDITKAWAKDLKQGDEFLLDEWKKPSSIDSTKSLLQEDVENILAIKENITSEFVFLKNDLSFLKGEGLRINKIVQSMRVLNRTSDDRRIYPLSELVKESFLIMADSMDQWNIKYFFKFEEADPELSVLVDKDEFTSAITNLIRNSIYAIKDKANQGGTISARIEESSTEVRLSIEDNGAGIDAANISKLFESNFSTKSREDGTGLGLSISRRFIRSFDGDLSLVSSDPEKGTKFVIILPKVGAKEKVSA